MWCTPVVATVDNRDSETRKTHYGGTKKGVGGGSGRTEREKLIGSVFKVRDKNVN